MTLTDYSSYFATDYSSSDCHEDCMKITLNLMMGASCDQSLDISQIHYENDSSNNIVVETAVPFEKYLCIEASTLGM